MLEILGDVLVKCRDGSVHIDVPDGIREIGPEAFEGCKTAVSICLPESVDVIGFGAFKWCSGLETISMPSHLGRLETGAFQYCWKLRSLRIPEGISTVSREHFLSCNSLEEIYLPRSISRVENDTFRDCHRLRRIHIDPSKLALLPHSARLTAMLTMMADGAEWTEELRGMAERRRFALFDVALKNKDTQAVHYMLGHGMADEVLDDWIDKTNRQHCPEILAMLLSYKHRSCAGGSISGDEFEL